MTISKNIESIMTRSSWIRRMFEQGAVLKAKYGAEEIFDFSLGNPNIKPPDKFLNALKNIVNQADKLEHSYMPNTGYPHVRKAVGEYLSKELEVKLSENEVIMTCGAAGALNVIFKTIINSGDEIVTPAPYFMEYNFYADNHGGILKAVPTKCDFTLDIDAISSGITNRTKAVLINSPNNPTGQVYSEESLIKLGNLLKKKGKALGKTLYLLSDEPYRKIIYDGCNVPSILKCYKESIIASSYSKDISIPGERIGYIAVNPEATYKEDLLNGMALANRILGFVNAPALMQKVVSSVQGSTVDIDQYARKKDLLCDGLSDCGYKFTKPLGAFYLFPETPIKDDVQFIKMLQDEFILAVPGSGFGYPGYFRIAFCVDDNTIINAMPGFKRAIDKVKT